MEQVFQELGRQGPLVLLLIVFLYGFWKRWWVFGYQLDECQKSNEIWMRRALRQLGLAEKATDTAEKLIPAHKRPRLEDLMDEGDEG